MTKRVRIILFIVFLLIGVLSLTYYFFTERQSHYTEEIVSDNADKLKSELKIFLQKAQNNVAYFKQDFALHSPDTLDNKTLNLYFSKELEKNEMASAIVLLGNNVQYIFGKDHDSWLSTFDKDFADSMTTWHRYDKNLNEISSWSDVYGAVLPLNTIKKIKKTKLNDNGVWLVFHSNSEERENVLMNVMTIENNKNEEFVLAFVYYFKNLRESLESPMGNTNILISIISSDNDVCIAFMDESQTLDSNGVNLTSNVSNIIDKWKKDDNWAPGIFSFAFLKKNYWSKIDTIISDSGVTAFAYTTRESDLVKIEEEKDMRLLFLAFFSFLLAFIFRFLFRKKKNGLVEPIELKQLSNSEIESILKKGETEIIEFKSSLRWDYHQEKANALLENVILKTIAAFTNADGGYLFIGVNDDGKVLGLEYDYNTFKKQNLDYFELHIRKIINNQFGIPYSQQTLKIEFPKIDGHYICVITINAALKPQFLKMKDKNGQMAEKFYVRTGNSSQEISSLEEINDYLNRRF
jgi:general stress protein 26